MDAGVASESLLTDEDGRVVVALRNGDEAAFGALVDRYHQSMIRVARSYVASNEAAEDVVQDAWIGVIQGIDRFESRSSLKTWIFRIVINKAITRGTRDARSTPFSSMGHGSMHGIELGADEPAVDPSRFRDAGRWVGWWSAPPSAHDVPEHALLSNESRQLVDAVIVTLPPSQRLVITLRDVQGMTAPEACELLGLSEANQRVLLHRARSKVRAALEGYFGARALGAS